MTTSTLLFQGDSITDGGRRPEDGHKPNQQTALGSGYPWFAAAALLGEGLTPPPRIYNRGVSGDKVTDLLARWDRDTLALEPDLLTILVGVNDVWHRLEGLHEGTVASYRADYRALLARTRQTLPGVQLVLGEPFVLRCGQVDERWFPTMDEVREVVATLAEETGALFVPFQQVFDRAVAHAPPEHWAEDGVHPSAHGAALMAHTWARVVRG